MKTLKALFGVKQSAGRGSKATRNELLEILHGQLSQRRNVVYYNFSDREDFVKQGYQGNSEVYKIIRKIVDKCAFPPTYVYEDKGEAGKMRQYRQHLKGRTAKSAALGRVYRAKALDFVPENNDLAQLIERPNDYQSWSELMELFRIFYQVQGEGFLYREAAKNSDIALSLHVAPANLMMPVFGGGIDNPITGWKLDLFGGAERELEAKDVFHLKHANPFFDIDGSQLRGQSPLLAGLKYLKLDDDAIESWLKAVQNEGARGLISPNHNNPDQWLNLEQVEETEKQVQEKIHGLKNRNKVVVSGMPLQYTQIGLSPDALAVIQALDTAQVKLADLWGVPPVLFDPNPTYQNQEAAAERFVSEVIIPYLEKEEQKLNQWLVKPFSERDGKNYYLDNDTSQFPELKVTLDEQSALAKILTINEMRIIEGWDTIDVKAADELLVDSGKIPLSDFDVELGI